MSDANKRRIVIPKEKTMTITPFARLKTLLYGFPKIGKSSLGEYYENPWILTFDNGCNGINAKQTAITCWEDFLEVCALAREDNGNLIKTLFVDDVDALYSFCRFYVLKQLGVEHESDAGFGKGWSRVKGEWVRVLTRLSALPLGLVFVSHEREERKETPTGEKVRIIPTLDNKPLAWLQGKVDNIFYYSLKREKDEKLGRVVNKRAIYTTTNTQYMAGYRTKGLVLPQVIIMESAEEGYAALKKAYVDGFSDDIRADIIEDTDFTEDDQEKDAQKGDAGKEKEVTNTDTKGNKKSKKEIEND